jgi:hypothetical protein
MIRRQDEEVPTPTQVIISRYEFQVSFGNKKLRDFNNLLERESKYIQYEEMLNFIHDNLEKSGVDRVIAN